VKALTIHNTHADEPDFCWGVECEIAVATPVVCDSPTCGCDRSHTGLNSHKASTTLMVRDTDPGFEDLVEACLGYLEAAGWADSIDDANQAAHAMVAQSAEIAAQFPIGTILRPTYDRANQEWHYRAAKEIP